MTHIKKSLYKSDGTYDIVLIAEDVKGLGKSMLDVDMYTIPWDITVPLQGIRSDKAVNYKIW